MALFGSRKDESDLGDVSKAIDYVCQQTKDKARLKSLISEYGAYRAGRRSVMAAATRKKIIKIIDKYM